MKSRIQILAYFSHLHAMKAFLLLGRLHPQSGEAEHIITLCTITVLKYSLQNESVM
uniref:Uncharacterized protein n=1 Tax=Anguilla anguilla TaxID=7936 RepID=A0A0E9TP40_ANGAN